MFSIVLLTLLDIASLPFTHSVDFLEPTQPPSIQEHLVDIVLDCYLVEEGGGRMGMFAASFTREKATFVLRKIPVPEDEALDSFTEFQPPAFDEEALIFEVTASSVQIPGADALLHADCNEQEVTCEVSQFYPRGENSEHEAWFIGSLQVSGGGISLTLVMKTQPMVETKDVSMKKQKKLGLPLSESGTILMSVQYNVFTQAPVVSTTIGGSVFLDCGFRAAQDNQDIFVEWRLQYKGHGRQIFTLESGPNVTGIGQAYHNNSHMDEDLVRTHQNVSLSLSNFKVADEGAYICLVTYGQFQAQQVINVQVLVPPRVQLIPKVLQFQNGATEKVVCDMSSYYPLDVQVEWTRLSPSSPTPEEPTPISQFYFSSHKQHSDGTYSLSAFILINQDTAEVGTTYTCSVSHVALEVPTVISVTLVSADESRILLIFGVMVATFIFLFAVYQLLLKWNTSKANENIQIKGTMKSIKIN
ncbi:tapasin-related protein-like isoform X1 [Erpetoichthys calabaricus]|uniref:Ig-like domain-containing protein n=2 Tax=Erpetoichthys calabaricus TaxID=27687 RepID=A0A8C4S8U3_ERPCA|nr:tapasin-related protein-like isoform X1 [Erpetoichthys calabaricus]XP_051787687.1 tapasin-related protein-like isoform X1 [Erpetoichthys calabaricus]